jgi:tetratricopeptide (TPR) repeat protein
MKKIILLVILFLGAGFVFGEELNEPAWVYKGRGDRYYENGEKGYAIFEYKNALMKANDNGNEYPEANLQLAKIYKDEGLYDLALFNLDLVQKNKEHLQIPDLVYDLLYTKAEIYVLMKKYEQALEAYENIVSQDDNWRSFSKQSLYEIEGSFMDDARLRKRFGEAYLMIGKIKLATYNYENAIPPLKMALLYKYRISDTLRYLISCYEKLENSRAQSYLHELLGRYGSS